MTEPAAPAEKAFSLDTSAELAIPELHRAVIGPIGDDYYLPIFSRFEDAGEATLSWNWSACLFSLNWLFFRGLWGVALVFAVVLVGMALLLLGLNQLVFDWPPEVLYGLIAACLSLGLLLPGAWGNALFFNHSRKAMVTAIEDSATLQLACAQLRQRAPSRGRFIRILMANVLLLAAAALAYTLLLPGAGVSFGTAAPEKTTEVTAEVAVEMTSETAAEPATPASQATSPVAELSLAALAPAASGASASASESAPAVVASDTAAAEPAAVSSSAKAVAASASASAPTLAIAPMPAPAPTPRSATTPIPVRESPASAAAPIAPAVPTASGVSRISIAKPTTQVTPEKPEKTTKPAKVAATKGFFVNAGLFAQPDNARNTLAKLKAAGLPAFSQELQTPQGPRTRVRVGPFANRAQAEAAIKKIRALKLDAALVKP